MTPTSEPTLRYKGGAWANSHVRWVRILRLHPPHNPAYYSALGLSFRTRSPMRLAR